MSDSDDMSDDGPDLNHDLTDAEMLQFVRSRGETALDMERAFTAYLDNTPNNPEGAGIRNWVWNAATQTGKSGGTYAQAFNGAVYYKDHIFERQYVSCIVTRRMKENDAELNGRERATFNNIVFQFIREMTNLHANICCIDAPLHTEKTNYFNVRLTNTAQPMTARLRAYLTTMTPSLGMAWSGIQGGSGLPGQTSIPDLKVLLKKNEDNINKKVRTAILDVLNAAVADLLKMPWIESDNAAMFSLGQYWAIDRLPFV